MKILAIDPGSTSTKVGVFDGEDILEGSFSHSRDEIGAFDTIIDQLEFRFWVIKNFITEKGFSDTGFDAVIGRGGLVKPLEGGVYRVNDGMLMDLTGGLNGNHASNLGGIIAEKFASLSGCDAFIADPVVVDEMDKVARLSGLKGVKRKSIFHALNQKEVARRVAAKLGNAYENLNLIVAHMGGGITVGAHKKGRVVDVNNGLNGDGPYSPERTGGLPLCGILEYMDETGIAPAEMDKIASGKGGVFSYLGTSDVREMERRHHASDSEASLVLEGMVYQIAKEIGAMAAVLDGQVDGVVLTGGIANSSLVTGMIHDKVKFIAEVYVEPGEHEIEALVRSAERVLKGETPIKEYNRE